MKKILQAYYFVIYLYIYYVIANYYKNHEL